MASSTKSLKVKPASDTNQEAGSRRREAGGRRQEAGGRRQEAETYRTYMSYRPYMFLAASCLLLPASCLLLLSPRPTGKDFCINTLRIAEHNETSIAHVLLGYPLNICWGDCTQLFDETNRITPAATQQFILSQLARLRGICLLAHVIRGQILGYHGLDVFVVHGVFLQTPDL